jgi:hypothetical protein
MPPVTIDGTSGITTPMYNGAITANVVTPSVNMKNRLINGNMTIDQRNAGASVTPSSDAYIVDRWKYEASQASKFTIGQNRGSFTPPAGFTNYSGYLTASAVTVGSIDYFLHEQYIEGFNTADLGWGTANAKTVTLSFWVRSSLTGTFGGNLQNNANDRYYPFSYTISSANTWEYKTVTIVGDTSGTWLTNNGTGILLRFSLGTGSTYLGTAGSWGSSTAIGVTGQTNVVGTLNATWSITGVQLEVGSTATSFDYRPYGTELALCQRYYTSLLNPELRGVVGSPAVTFNRMGLILPVTMRASPTISMSGTFHLYDGTAVGTSTSIAVGYVVGNNSVEVDLSITTGTFTALRPGLTYFNSNTSYINASAEL